MITEEIWTGVNTLIDCYAGVRVDDSVILAHTSDSREPAAWVSVALRARGIEPKHVWMAPLRDKGFPDRLRSAFPDPGNVSGRLIIMTFERDTMSHSSALRKAASEFGKDRCIVIRAISAGADLFSQALSVTPAELSARNTTILERCMAAKSLRIDTPGGTRLSVTLDPGRYIWISNRGVWRPGAFVLLPAGEVATFPASVDGVLVADYAFNVNILTDRDARLTTCPVTVRIEKGRVIDYECCDIGNRRFLDDSFAIPNARRVGELGFGTNFGVHTPVLRNSHINERRLGIHLGFGQHGQPPSIMDYSSDIHLDLIARGGRVWVDECSEPLDIETVLPSSNAHPGRLYGEDMTSHDELELDELEGDCCGLAGSRSKSYIS